MSRPFKPTARAVQTVLEVVMRHRCRTLMPVFSAALLALAVQAQAQENARSTDLLGVTCGDYLEGLRIANPGPQATTAQKAEAEDAQDDIVSALMWVHGYTSGRQAGTDLPPLTEAWMRDTVVKLAQSCKTHSTDGKMRLADAAAAMKL